jgi:hypothetical protein
MQDWIDKAIKAGTLWKYVTDARIYACPIASKEVAVSYTIVDSMNGWCGWDGATSRAMKITLRSQIRNTAMRMVFLDETRIGGGSWGLFYAQERWADSPPVRHGYGVSCSFMDGHAEYRKYTDQRSKTVTFLEQQLGNKDLYAFQRAVWGKLGYTPSGPE